MSSTQGNSQMRELANAQAARMARLEAMPVEVASPRNGRPAYRWAMRYVLVQPDGSQVFPPMTKREAKATCDANGWTLEEWPKQEPQP
jgi:hypothetical protein